MISVFQKDCIYTEINVCTDDGAAAAAVAATRSWHLSLLLGTQTNESRKKKLREKSQY